MNRIKTYEKNVLEKDIDNYELKLPTLNTQERIKVVKLRNEVKVINEQKFIEENRGIQIRSRAKNLCESDQNLHYFKYLEQKHQTNNRITCLKDKHDNIVNNTENILKTSKEYYNKLFSSKTIDDTKIAKYLDETELNYKITPEEADLCEDNISEEECYNVINKYIKINKTPGHDGLPIEFYRIFWDQIKKPLLESFKYAFLNNDLSFSHR